MTVEMLGKERMRRTLLAVSLAMTLSSSLPVAAAEARRQTLAVVGDAWDTLRQQGRVEQLGQLMAEDFVLIDTDGRIQRKPDYLMYLVARPGLSDAILNEESSTRFYGDMAIINSVSAQSGTERQRITRVWQWDGDSWLLVSSHASRILQN